MALTDIGYPDFIKNFKDTLTRLFHEENDIDKLSLNRGLPPHVLSEILSQQPLSVAIPKAYGGRQTTVSECLYMLEATSYESLPLSLMFGINIGLFLYPVTKYAHESVKQDIFTRFLKNNHMGGMMITEPNHGSDALNMKTFHRKTADGYHLQGTKHWQGLTGMAEYWLIACRKEISEGNLGRDIEFFICDHTQPEQRIVVEEYFNTMGLYLIPYGRNKINVDVPATFKLEPESSGINMMLDILHRSRLQIAGIGMGFIKRMMDEAMAHCKGRHVGAGNLLSMDQVQFQISRMQSAYTICSAMVARSCAISGLDRNLAGEGIEANSIKAVVTDLMQETAQILVQLSGANGFKMDHIGGRGIMDSRPFQIFEGPNEMLFIQIAEMVTKLMKKEKQSHFYEFLKSYKLTSEACTYFKKDLCFMLNTTLSQRKLFDLGRIIGKVVAVSYVLDLKSKGFRADLVDNCITTVQHKMSTMANSFHYDSKVQAVEDYADNSSWMDFV